MKAVSGKTTWKVVSSDLLAGLAILVVPLVEAYRKRMSETMSME